MAVDRGTPNTSAICWTAFSRTAWSRRPKHNADWSVLRFGRRPADSAADPASGARSLTNQSA
ncbi:hypothetical protein ACFCW6_25740 [Streptomyces sp. NPDC056333]|uniref:hypothetical protein n=1 Tax=Streptomyces sp. NPDC056333 TaxID=3345786 RepID=UPI0035DA75DA